MGSTAPHILLAHPRYLKLKEVAEYSRTRIDSASCLNSYVSVETLLPEKKGLSDSLPEPSEKTAISFQKGDILLGNIRPYLKKIWLSDRDGGTNGDVLVIRIRDVETVTPEYLYYVLSSDSFFHYDVQNSKGAKMPRGDKSSIMEYVVPVPTIAVQNEIVRTLDSFTALTAELTAELTARKIQYEFYRDKLLSFDHLTPEERERSGVRWMTLEELFTFKNGLNKGKEFFGSGTPIVNFKDVYNNNRLTSKDLCGKVVVTKSEELRFEVQKGDVFFTRTSETREDIGIASVLVDDVENCVFSGFVLRARPKTNLLLPEYSSYCFASSDVRREIIKSSTYTTRALTSGSALSKIIIPVPNKETQSRIVSNLDKMNILCNNLYSGIPAEIEARRKQYEYYRNKLLSFEEASS